MTTRQLQLHARPPVHLPGEDLGGGSDNPAPRQGGAAEALRLGLQIERAFEDQEARFSGCPSPSRPPPCLGEDGEKCGYLDPENGRCLCPRVRRPPTQPPTFEQDPSNLKVNQHPAPEEEEATPL